MKTLAKVAAGLSVGLVAASIVFVSSHARPSLATSPTNVSSAPITAPIVVDPIPGGMASPPISAHSALDAAYAATGTMMEQSTSIQEHIVTAAMLTRSGIDLPTNFDIRPSVVLWIVSISGLNMPVAGPSGANLPPDHQLNAVVNAQTGKVIEMYSYK